MALYKLITSLKTKEKIQIESELIKEARSEWDELLCYINEETKERIAVIGVLIDNVSSQRTNLGKLKDQAKTAEKVFINVVEPIYKKEKENRNQQPKLNADSISSDSTRRTNGEPTDEHQNKYVSRVKVTKNQKKKKQKDDNKDQLPQTCDTNWDDAPTDTEGTCAKDQSKDKKNPTPSTKDKRQTIQDEMKQMREKYENDTKHLKEIIKAKDKEIAKLQTIQDEMKQMRVKYENDTKHLKEIIKAKDKEIAKLWRSIKNGENVANWEDIEKGSESFRG